MKNLLIVATSALCVLLAIAVPLPEQDVQLVQIPLQGNKVCVSLFFSFSKVDFSLICGFDNYGLVGWLLPHVYLSLAIFSVVCYLYACHFFNSFSFAESIQWPVSILHANLTSRAATHTPHLSIDDVLCKFQVCRSSDRGVFFSVSLLVIIVIAIVLRDGF